MGIFEMILLAAGAVVFIVSFCIPVKEEKLKEETKNLAAQEVKSLVAEELENVRGRLEELSEEEMKEQIEKSERSMERISNEKIMAVNEYSDTVLEEIHKNHEEVVFLYDMLKNKKAGLSESYEKVERDLKELLQQVKDSEVTVRENLEEISRKQKELAKEKAEAASGMAFEKQTSAAVQKSRQAKEQREVKERIEEQQTGQAGADFKPFVPETIEAAPKKKARTAKTAKKPAAEPVSSVEKAEVTFLLQDGPGSGGAENSNERILGLHKAGKSNMAIARELGLGIGEVKLVIDLYEGL